MTDMTETQREILELVIEIRASVERLKVDFREVNDRLGGLIERLGWLNEQIGGLNEENPSLIARMDHALEVLEGIKRRLGIKEV